MARLRKFLKVNDIKAPPPWQATARPMLHVVVFMTFNFAVFSLLGVGLFGDRMHRRGSRPSPPPRRVPARTPPASSSILTWFSPTRLTAAAGGCFEPFKSREAEPGMRCCVRVLATAGLARRPTAGPRRQM